MADSYYSLPIGFSKVFNKKEIPRIGMADSISQNINLILITEHGENRFDLSYGCPIWDDDFENVFSNNIWQERNSREIAKTLAKFEPRLTQIEVNTTIGEESFLPNAMNKGFRVKRRVIVKISARLVLTDEPYNFTTKLYISPISMDE